jgi:hypothetical protein
LAVYFPLDFSGGEETLVHLSNYTAKPHGRLAACMLPPISFRVLQMCASRDAGMWRKKWTRRLFCIIKRKLCMSPLCTQFVLLDCHHNVTHKRKKLEYKSVNHDRCLVKYKYKIFILLTSWSVKLF